MVVSILLWFPKRCCIDIPGIPRRSIVLLFNVQSSSQMPSGLSHMNQSLMHMTLSGKTTKSTTLLMLQILWGIALHLLPGLWSTEATLAWNVERPLKDSAFHGVTMCDDDAYIGAEAVCQDTGNASILSGSCIDYGSHPGSAFNAIRRFFPL